MSTLYLPPQYQGSQDTDDLWLGYIRVSTWKEEKISPELQESAIRQWAARTGRCLLEPMIVDLDESGRHFKRKIMGAIERVERREARGIAVWRFSRFGRNRTGNAANLARLEAVGGELESATEPVDARTAVGELQREMIFAFGNFESNRAGEQWRETHEYRLQHQLPATGRRRFGYVWHPRRVPDMDAAGGWRLQDERYVFHPDHASILQEMYERKLAKPVPQGLNTIAHWLNEEVQVRTLRGALWSTSSIARYMDSGFAAGWLRTHDRECRCGYSNDPSISKCPYNRMLFLPGAQPKIIESEEWEEYQAHRKLTKNIAPRARKATYTLSGMLAHGRCRHHISHASDTRKTGQVNGYWLVCTRNKHVSKSACAKGINVKREQVENEVFDWLGREGIAADIDAAPATPGEDTAPKVDPKQVAQRQRANLTRELKTIDAAIDRLVEENALNPNKYPGDSFERVKNKFLGSKGKLLKQLGDLGEAVVTPVREDFQELIVGLLAEWESFKPIEKNAMLLQIVRRVVCYDIRDAEGKLLSVRTEIHPVWEPDPWAPKKVCRGLFGTRADWSPAELWIRPGLIEAEVEAALAGEIEA
ncbi:recombinase family protein [Streptomyces prunicolor]|uniref:recombinase family protein n=1 Tax=Streptomyces prunicolor TaxID=67348 RepID=UPI00036D494E|nr:recombinase family protein [Streptomyces prunicolor]